MTAPPVLARVAPVIDVARNRTCDFYAWVFIMTKIYVGNLPFTATEDSVRALFSTHGAVESVALPNDRETGRMRGFGFVQMSNADAATAIAALNGHSMEGRALKVNEAQDRPPSGNRSAGGFRTGSRW
jgi:RNA recognition motif-containing protein